MDAAASQTKFDTWMTRWESETTIAQEDYRGVTIYNKQEVTSAEPEDDRYVCYAHTSEYIIVAFASMPYVMGAIDKMLDGGDSLADSANFIEAQANLPDRIGSYFCDYFGIYGACMETFDDLGEEAPPGWEMAIMLAEAAQVAMPPFGAMALHLSETGLNATVYQPFPSSVSVTSENNTLDSTQLVPADALFFASQQYPNAVLEAIEQAVRGSYADIISTLTADLEWMTLSDALIELLNDPVASERRAEKRKVEDAVREMMEDNWLEWIPNPQDSESGPASNDMMTFPDNVSEAGTSDKEYDPVEGDPALYQADLDKDGYVLYGHDRTADGAQDELVDYIDVTTTTYYYTVWSDGHVEQWSDAAKTTRYDDGGPDFNQIWDALNPIITELSTMSLEQILDLLLIDPDRPAREEEKRKVEQAVRDMMEDNWLQWIPHAQDRESGPASNDMTTFPDNVSEAGTFDKEWDPVEGDPAQYQAGLDKDGYVLYGHDRLADGAQDELVDYIDVTTTTYYYTVWSDGHVEQWSDAAKTTRYSDGGPDFNAIWGSITPVLTDLTGLTLEQFVSYLLTEAGVDLGTIWSDGIAPILSDLSTLTLLEALDYMSSDPDATARRAEKRMVERANREMIQDNYLDWIPHPQDSSGPATNDMTSFPDNTSVAGTDDKRWEPPEGDPWEPVEGDPAEYTELDKNGYVLYGHDKTADGATTPTVDYIDVATTVYYYTCWSDGNVQQYSDADKTTEYHDGDFDLNLLWADIVPLLGDMSEMISAHEAIVYLQENMRMQPQGMIYIWLLTEILAETTGIGLDESWPELTTHFDAVSTMTLQEAVVYLDTEMGWGLDQWWTDNQSVFADLSLLSRVDAIDYLNTNLGIDLNGFWTSDVNPIMADLSTKTVGEAIVYGAQHLPVDPLDYWARITPVLTDLAPLTVSQAILYMDTELGLGINQLWTDIQVEMATLSGMTLEQALVYLESATDLVIRNYLSKTTGPVFFTDLVDALAQDAFDAVELAIDTLFDSTTGEGSLALLPIDFAGATDPVIIPDISVFYEVANVADFESALDDVFSLFSPFVLGWGVGQTGAPSTAVEEVPVNGTDEGTGLKVYSVGSNWGDGTPTFYMSFFSVGEKDYLVVSNTENAMVETINAHYGFIPSLDNTEEYQGIISSLPADRVGLGYLNMSDWLNTIMDVMVSNASSEEEEANLEAIRSFIPSKSALAFSGAIVGTDALTVSFTVYLLPPPLVHHEVPTGTTGTVLVPEQEADFSQFDPDVGQIAVSIDVDVTDTPEGGSIDVIAMLELPEDTVAGFELAATDAGLSIVDVAYGISVNHDTLPDDNIGEATITMKVDRMWADNYGVDNVRIIRVSNGTNEVLPTVFVGYEGDYAVFEGTSANGLSEFGLVAIADTTFALSGFSIDPEVVLPGEDVTIQVTVNNTGDTSASYNVVLEINDEVADSQEVTVDASSSQVVEFIVTETTPGTYIVDIGGLNDSFEVIDPSGVSCGCDAIPGTTGDIASGWALLGFVGVAGIFASRKGPRRKR